MRFLLTLFIIYIIIRKSTTDRTYNMIATQENQEIIINSNAVRTANSFIGCLAKNSSIAFLGDTDCQ